MDCVEPRRLQGKSQRVTVGLCVCDCGEVQRFKAWQERAPARLLSVLGEAPSDVER